MNGDYNYQNKHPSYLTPSNQSTHNPKPARKPKIHHDPNELTETDQTQNHKKERRKLGHI
jgi:hypothetical protein